MIQRYYSPDVRSDMRGDLCLYSDYKKMESLIDYIMGLDIDDCTEDQVKLIQYAVGQDRDFWICPECSAPVTEVGDTCENCSHSRA